MRGYLYDITLAKSVESKKGQINNRYLHTVKDFRVDFVKSLSSTQQGKRIASRV